MVPDWSVHTFLVLERECEWTPAIALELADAAEQVRRTTGRVLPGFRVEHVADNRTLSARIRQPSTVAVILRFSGQERECLAALGRLRRAARRLKTLCICDRGHEELIPVLLEDAVDGVLIDPVNDVPVADWCLRALSKVVPEPAFLPSRSGK